MICATYFHANLPECSSSIELRAHLTPSVQYTWTVRDLRFDTHYIGTATADANGSLMVSRSAPFPAGLFNRHAGCFEITVKRDPSQCGNSPMTFCIDELTTSMYFAAVVQFHESIGVAEPVAIGCNCGIVPPEEPDPNASLVFPFTNQTSFTITHNLGRPVQVSVYDTLGNQIVVSVVQSNLNQIQITSSQPISGTVVID